MMFDKYVIGFNHFIIIFIELDIQNSFLYEIIVTI